MTLVVDREHCIGAGQCVLSAPETFDQDDVGLVVVLEPLPPGPVTAQVLDAVRLCPSGALLLQDHDPLDPQRVANRKDDA